MIAATLHGPQTDLGDVLFPFSLIAFAGGRTVYRMPNLA